MTEKKTVKNLESKPKKARKKYKTRTTGKQKKLTKLIAENSEKPLGELMIQAGYSVGTSKSPSRILPALTFREKFDSAIGDKFLLSVHKRLLKSKNDFGMSKGLELGYKIKGAFAPVETKHTITGLETKSDAEINELLAEEERTLQRAQNFKPTNQSNINPVLIGEVLSPEPEEPDLLD